jgi:pyruvate ferredoxin oxidoreductase beta subunit
VCPTGWRCPSDQAISLGRLAVETGIFPLYEVENGKYKLSAEMPKKFRPIKDYYKSQGRYRHLTEDEIKMIQDRVNKEYKKLLNKVKCLDAWS